MGPAIVYPPLVEIATSERQPSSDELTRIAESLETRVEIISALGGAVKSERISYSDQFGYIFRYESLSDHPSSTRTYYVLWSKEGETFEVATGTNFNLDSLIVQER